MTRIVKFEAENFKRLKAVEIIPDENTVVIKGRNAQGKSSVLDAIMAALAGKKGSKELVRPIRDGETKARVALELDDLVVERKWTKSGSSVTVGPKGGNARLNSPQAVLDKLIGALSFDPLAFAEAEPKQQVETLIDLIGRERFDEIAAERKDAYEIRTENNREAKRVQAQIDGLGDDVPQSGEPPKVDVPTLVDELGVARRRVALTEEWERLKQRMLEIEAEGRSLPQTRPVEELTTLLADAERLQDVRYRWEQRQVLTGVLERTKQTSEDCTAKIAQLDEDRVKLIESAALPVDGLSFDDEGVSYNGVPFVQASAAERLKVSVGMAMALNPELRVICIRDASLLDDESKMALIELAKQHDYQIWYEVVGKAGDIGVVIEDGEVEA